MRLTILILFLAAVVMASVALAADEAIDTTPAPDNAAAVIDAEEPAGEHTMAEIAPPPAGEDPPTAFDFLLSGKYLAFLILSAIGLILLFGKWVNVWVRLVMLVVAFVLFGLDQLYPMHPSPMCGLTKLFMFKFTHGQFFPALLMPILIFGFMP